MKSHQVFGFPQAIMEGAVYVQVFVVSPLNSQTFSFNTFCCLTVTHVLIHMIVTPGEDAHSSFDDK